jgi:hypothetical protein
MMVMPQIALLIALATLAGAVAGGVTARWLLSHQQPDQTVPTPPDPWVSAEIDQAATRWAMEHGRPEAAGPIADKLHLLHDLGQRRGWWQ